MINPTQSATSTVSSVSSTVLDKARQALTRFSDYCNWRMTEAAADFNYTLERELQTTATPAMILPKKPAKEMTVAGFLVSNSNDRPIPLYEGSNYFAVRENARVRRLMDEAAGLDFDYDIKIGHDGIRMVSSKPTLTSKVIDANEFLILGKERFSLKLVPTEYRLKKMVGEATEDSHDC